MPIYFCHGFRWPREGYNGIRVKTIVGNLEDVSSEYIQNEQSRTCVLEYFRSQYPEIMKELERPGRAIDFIEQYDPDDESPNATTQPWAFVCDRVIMIAGGVNAEYYASKLLQNGGRPSPAKPRKKTLPMTIAAPFNAPADITALSANIEDITADGPGISTEAWQALADLRDELAEGEKIGWWIVYNGDPDRDFDDETPTTSTVKEGPSKLLMGGRMPPPIPPANVPSQSQRASTLPSQTSSTPPSSRSRSAPALERPPSDKPNSKTGSKGKGLKKFFGKKS